MSTALLQSPECIRAVVRDDTSFAEVLRLLTTERKNTCVMTACASSGTLLGLISQSDAIKAILKLADERRAPAAAQVKEVTTFPPGGVVSIRASEDVSPLALSQVMAECNIKHIPIIDDAGLPAGVIGAVTAARTLLQYIEEDKAALAAASRSISGDLFARAEMGLEAPMLRVPHDMPITDIARLALQYKATFAVVVKDKQFVGILTLVDLLRAFAKLPADAPPVFGPPAASSEASGAAVTEATASNTNSSRFGLSSLKKAVGRGSSGETSAPAPLPSSFPSDPSLPPSPVARDIMIPKARVLSLDPASADLHIPAAMRLMTANGIRHVPIIKKSAPVAAPVSLFGMLAATAASIFNDGTSGTSTSSTATSGVIEKPVDVLDILRCAREVSRALPLDPKAKDIISRMGATGNNKGGKENAVTTHSGGGRASRASSLADEVGLLAPAGRRASTAGSVTGGGSVAAEGEQASAVTKPTVYTINNCPSDAYNTLLVAKRALKKLDDIRGQMVRAQASGAALSREDEAALEAQVRAAMTGAASKLGLCIRKLEAADSTSALPASESARLAVALHRENIRVTLATAQFLLRVGAPDDELMDALSTAMGAVRDHKARVAAAVAAGYGSTDAGGMPAPGTGIEPEATVAVISSAGGADGSEDALSFVAGKLPPFPDTEVLRLRLVVAHAVDLDAAVYPFAGPAAVVADQIRDVDLAPLVAAASDPRHRFSSEAFRGVEVVLKALTACGKLQNAALDGVLGKVGSGGGAPASLTALMAAAAPEEALASLLTQLAAAPAGSPEVIGDAIATVGTHFSACTRVQPWLLRLGHALEAGGAGDAPIIKTMQAVPPALPSLACVLTAALLHRALTAASAPVATLVSAVLTIKAADAPAQLATVAGVAPQVVTKLLPLLPRAQALVWSQAATDERLTLRHLQVGGAAAAAAPLVAAVAGCASGAATAVSAWAQSVASAVTATAAQALPAAGRGLLAQGEAACAAIQAAGATVVETGAAPAAVIRGMPYLHITEGQATCRGAAVLLTAAAALLPAEGAAAEDVAADGAGMSLDDLSAMLASLQAAQ